MPIDIADAVICQLRRSKSAEAARVRHHPRAALHPGRATGPKNALVAVIVPASTIFCTNMTRVMQAQEHGPRHASTYVASICCEHRKSRLGATADSLFVWPAAVRLCGAEVMPFA